MNEGLGLLGFFSSVSASFLLAGDFLGNWNPRLVVETADGLLGAETAILGLKVVGALVATVD